MVEPESLGEGHEGVEVADGGNSKKEDPPTETSVLDLLKKAGDLLKKAGHLPLDTTGFYFYFYLFELALEFAIFITSCVLLHQGNEYTQSMAPIAIFIFVTRVFPLVIPLYEKYDWVEHLNLVGAVTFLAGDILRIVLVIYAIAASQNFASGDTPSNVIYATYSISEAILFLLPVPKQAYEKSDRKEDILQRISFMLGISSLANACVSFTVAASLSAVEKANAAILFLASILALPMSFILLLHTSYDAPLPLLLRDEPNELHLQYAPNELHLQDAPNKLHPKDVRNIKSNLKLLTIIGSVVGIIVCSVGVQNGDQTIMGLVIHILTLLNAPELILGSVDIVDTWFQPEVNLTL